VHGLASIIDWDDIEKSDAARICLPRKVGITLVATEQLANNESRTLGRGAKGS